MSFINDQIGGRLLDWMMSAENFSVQRREVLKDASGEVLEIGFGTGLNLPHYTGDVRRLTIIDPAAMLPKRVDARIAAAPFPVERAQLSAERLPFEDRRFDCVVSTWTLCTIPKVETALTEIRRVLKPEGRFVFLEHGRSDDHRTARLQDLFNPIQKFVAGGCNLNRKMDDLIRQAGLKITRIDRYLMSGMPR